MNEALEQMSRMKTYTFRHTVSPEATHFPTDEQWRNAEVALLDEHRWTDHAFHPSCQVRGLYTDESLFLRFRTEEKELATSRTRDGDEVWKDNCVEFFVSPSEDLSAPYLNFEFNLLGVMLLGVGPDRENRKKLTAEQMREIVRKPDHTSPVLDQSPRVKTWELQVLIPLRFLQEQTGCPLPGPGTVWRGNFNNCAADVEHPYYGNWNPIETDRPDFHRPEYFGRLVFG